MAKICNIIRACERLGCLNDECERYSFKYGYICNDCFTELTNKGAYELTNIRDFMNSDKIPKKKFTDEFILPKDAFNLSLKKRGFKVIETEDFKGKD